MGAPGPRTDWSDVEKARCKALYLEGKSATEVSTALFQEFKVRRSRSAVLGCVHRAGVKREAASNALQTTLNARRGAASTKAIKRPAKPAAAVAPAPSSRPHAGKATVWPVTASAVALDQLKARHCRWPVGMATGAAMLFCGATRPEGAVYCPDHAPLAYSGKTARNDLFSDKALPRWAVA